MQYSNTTTKAGMLQECEFWCNLGDGGITSNATLKAVFTNRLNRHYEMSLAKANLTSQNSKIDDSNYTDQDFSTFNIVSGTHDYTFLTDANGNTIADITGLLILTSATATQYQNINKLTVDDANALLIMSPNSLTTGVPTGFIERNNTIFFDKIPNYSAAAGGKLFFRRSPSFFTTSDSTKEPGFATDYHILLPLESSYDWLCVNKPQETILITRVESKLTEMRSNFNAYCEMKSPNRKRMTARTQNNR